MVNFTVEISVEAWCDQIAHAERCVFYVCLDPGYTDRLYATTTQAWIPVEEPFQPNTRRHKNLCKDLIQDRAVYLVVVHQVVDCLLVRISTCV